MTKTAFFLKNNDFLGGSKKYKVNNNITIIGSHFLGALWNKIVIYLSTTLLSQDVGHWGERFQILNPRVI